MQAMMLLGPGRMAFQPTAIPEPGEDDIVLKIGAALTCGTDLKAFRRGHPKWPPPVRFGHEYAGTVAARGSRVQSVREGDAVMVAPTGPCGRVFLLSACAGKPVRVAHGDDGAGRLCRICADSGPGPSRQSLPQARPAVFCRGVSAGAPVMCDVWSGTRGAATGRYRAHHWRRGFWSPAPGESCACWESSGCMWWPATHTGPR